MNTERWVTRYPADDPENGPARLQPVGGCVKCGERNSEHYTSKGECVDCSPCYVTPVEEACMKYTLPEPSRIFDWFPCPRCFRQAPMVNPDDCRYEQLHECPGCRYVFKVK